MPKLLDKSALGARPAPSARRQIVGIDGGQVARAIEGAGDALYRTGGRIQDAEDRTNFAKARALFEKERAEADSEFDANPDFEAAQKAYEARLEKAKADSTALIRGGDRELFADDRDVDIARSKGRISGVVQARRREARRADLFSTLDDLKYAAVRHPDNDGRNALVASGYLAIEGALQKGEVSAVEAQEWKRKFGAGISEDWVSLLPEEEQVRLLSGGGTSNEKALIQRESGGDPKNVNQFGYAGLYQFGAPRLAEIGVYTPGNGEKLADWSKSPKDAPGKWSGTFNIPGHPEVKTLEQFRNSPEAQKVAFDIHAAKMDREIEENGFAAYEGKTVGGVKITRDGLRNMLHLGGVGGTKAALEGKGNPKDANGTSVMDYARMGAGEVQVASAGGTMTDAKPPGPRNGIDLIDPVKRQAMLEAAQTRLQQKAEAGRVEREARQTQAVTDDLFNRYGTSPDGEAKALAEIRTKYAGKEENALVTAYTGRAAEARRLEHQAKDGRFTAAADKIRAGGELTPQEEAEILREDPKAVDTLRQMQRDLRAGNPEVTDHVWMWENYYSLSEEERSKVPLARIKAHMAYDGYQKIAEAHQKNEAADPSEITVSEAFNNAVKILDFNKNTKDGVKEIDAFNKVFVSRVREVEARGKPMTTEEKRDLLNKMVGEMSLKTSRGGFFGLGSGKTTGPAYRFDDPTSDEFKETLSGISESVGRTIRPEEMQGIMRTMRSRNIEPTMDNILRVYWQGVDTAPDGRY